MAAESDAVASGIDEPVAPAQADWALEASAGAGEAAAPALADGSLEASAGAGEADGSLEASAGADPSLAEEEAEFLFGPRDLQQDRRNALLRMKDTHSLDQVCHVLDLTPAARGWAYTDKESSAIVCSMRTTFNGATLQTLCELPGHRCKLLLQINGKLDECQALALKWIASGMGEISSQHAEQRAAARDQWRDVSA